MSKPNPDLLDYHRAQRDRIQNSLDALLSSSSLGKEMHDAIRDGETIITAPRERDYRLPAHFSKTMAPRRLTRLRELLSELWQYRTQLVGLSEEDAKVIYNGDPFTLLLRDEFVDWSVGHLEDRLAKPSVKDRGDPYNTFWRLQEEFLYWWENLALCPGTGHGVALAEVASHLHWVLFKRTWGRGVTFGANGSCDFDFDDPLQHELARFYLSRSGLIHEGRIPTIARAFPSVAVPIEAMPEDPRAELMCMASDLREVQGRLARSFAPEDHVITITEGVFATWIWATIHRAGVVFISDSPEGACHQALGQSGVIPVGIGLDGLPTELAVPLKRFDTEAMIRWTLGLLRPIHEHLFREWERVGPIIEDNHSEVADIALASEAILTDEDTEEGPQSPARPRVRVPAVRTSKLLSVLTRHFDCEVRRGKGSEISIFRPGGHIYTLPGHQKNTHYPTWMIRALLKTIGVTPREFAEVVCRRVQTH